MRTISVWFKLHTLAGLEIRDMSFTARWHVRANVIHWVTKVIRYVLFGWFWHTHATLEVWNSIFTAWGHVRAHVILWIIRFRCLGKLIMDTLTSVKIWSFSLIAHKVVANDVWWKIRLMLLWRCNTDALFKVWELSFTTSGHIWANRVGCNICR